MNPNFEKFTNKNRQIPQSSIEGDKHTAQHNEMTIDIYRLIHVVEAQESTYLPLSSFLNQFNDNCWSDTEGNKISPEQVIKVMERSEDLKVAIHENPSFEKHIKQILASDYNHPIIVFEGVIIDGMHRLAKAYLEKCLGIAVKTISQIPDEAILDK